MWTKFAAEISPGRNLSHQREAGVTSRPAFEVPSTAASADGNGASRPAFEVPSTAASADGGKSDSPVPGSKRGNPSPYHSPGNDAASLSNDVHGLKRQGILGTPKKLFASMFDDNSFVEDSAGNDDDDDDVIDCRVNKDGDDDNSFVEDSAGNDDDDDDVIDCRVNKDGDDGNNGGSWVSDAAFTDEEIFSEVNTRAKKDRVAASLLSNDALVSKLTVGLKQLGYVSFSSDWQAAGAVSVALGQKPTLCEFGTGTGKTMTFLLPSVCAHEQRDDGPVLGIFPLIALSRNMVVGTRERTGLGPRAVVALDGGSSKLAREEIICRLNEHDPTLRFLYVTSTGLVRWPELQAALCDANLFALVRMHRYYNYNHWCPCFKLHLLANCP
jgi:hypothetical protein